MSAATKPAAKPVTAEMAEFGRRLKALADQRGWDEADVADLLGYTAFNIRALFQGQNTVAYVKLADLCRRLSVTPNYLLGFEPAPDPRAASAPDPNATTKLVDVIAGMLIQEGWDEGAAVATAEGVLRFAQEPMPDVQNPRAWVRAIAAERARQSRAPRGNR